MEELIGVLVLTRSPFSEATGSFLNLVDSLSEQVSDVRMYLFYDGVLAAKKGNRMESGLRAFTRKGVKVFVDGREFKARGLGKMVGGLEVLDHPVSKLVDEIMRENSRVIVV